MMASKTMEFQQCIVAEAVRPTLASRYSVSCLREMEDITAFSVFASPTKSAVIKVQNINKTFNLINVLDALRQKNVDVLDVVLFAPVDGDMYAYVHVLGLNKNICKQNLKMKGSRKALKQVLVEQESSWNDLSLVGFECDAVVPFKMN